MWKHLWTKQPPPSEYVTLILCERFGIGILHEDADLVETFLAMIDVEATVANTKARNRAFGNK